jgi:hypothetical protein
MAPSTLNRTEARLTPGSFKRLLDTLDPDPRRAGMRYEILRGRLILFFLRRMLGSPEDLADQVMDRLARRMHEGEEILSIEGYALGIARFVVREQDAVHLPEGSHRSSFLENTLASNATKGDEAFEREQKDRQLDAMERSLGRLPEAEIELLTSYYLVEQREKIATRKRIALKLGVTQAALRKKIYGICSRLRASINAETEDR